MQYNWWDVQADMMQPECALYQLILKLWSMCHFNGCAYAYEIPALKLWKTCPSSPLLNNDEKKKKLADLSLFESNMAMQCCKHHKKAVFWV